MSRGKGAESRRVGDVRALLVAGDHRAAAVAARALLADPRAQEGERAGAAAVLASLRPEPAAVLLGVGCAVASVALTLAVLLGR
jgi:hypothetical protein